VLALVVSAGCASRVSHEQAAQDAAALSPAGSAVGESTNGPAIAAPGVAAPEARGRVQNSAPGAVRAEAQADTSAPGPARSDAGPGAAGAATGAAASSTGDHTPIPIGSVSTLTGIVGEGYINGMKALRAWVSDVNTRGGVAGHPIRLFAVDDGGAPSRNQALMQQMVEQNHVVAFVWNTAPLSGQASVAYVQGKRIPVIGSEAADSWFNANSMYFPQQSTAAFGARAFAAATAKEAIARKLSKVALMYCLESQGCKDAVASDAFAQAGLQVVQQSSISLAQPDFTSQCLSARNAGAQVVFIASDSQSIIRFADNCANIGFHPLYAWTAQGTKDTLLADKNLEGGVVGSTGAPWFAAKTPAQQEFQRVFAKHAPGADLDGGAITGWTSAKLFEKAVQKLSEAPSPATILQALWSLTNEDLGGLTYPMTFRQGDPNNSVHERTCYWTVVIRDGRWTSPDNYTRHCV
jgi:branched-chain amino acid transport system substrate-binding protein